MCFKDCFTLKHYIPRSLHNDDVKRCQGGSSVAQCALKGILSQNSKSKSLFFLMKIEDLFVLEERERASVCCFTPQILTTMPVASSRSPLWLTGTQTLGPSCAAFLRKDTDWHPYGMLASWAAALRAVLQCQV